MLDGYLEYRGVDPNDVPATRADLEELKRKFG